jgi:GNAT superfamily N-acetyltransferase
LHYSQIKVYRKFEPFGERGTVQLLFSTRPIENTDRQWLKHFLREHWGSNKIITRGRIHYADRLPGLIAVQNVAGQDFSKGERVGVVTYHCLGNECEVITLDSLLEGIGIGTALLIEVEKQALELDCKRLWLVTTNDNALAIKFYLRRGFRLACIHRGSVDQARHLKPEIPLIGLNGIPIHDEIEMDKQLR